MKPEQIFYGNILKCTKYEEHISFSSKTYIDDQCISSESFGYITEDHELYKENAILIKTKNGGYVDLENLNSILDHIKVYKDITKNGYRIGGLIMSTSSSAVDRLFVDEKSLTPYYTNKKPKNVSARQLKKEQKRK